MAEGDFSRLILAIEEALTADDSDTEPVTDELDDALLLGSDDVLAITL